MTDNGRLLQDIAHLGHVELLASSPAGTGSESKPREFLVFAPDFNPVLRNEESRATSVYRGAALPDSFLPYATPDL